MNARQSKEIEQLYQQMYSKLFVYARSVLENDALAEEAVQDTFHIACQKVDAVCGSPNPKGWLFNTLKYVISNELRSRSIAKRILMDYFALNINDISISNDHIGLEIIYTDIADTEEFKLLKEMALEGKSHLEMAQARGITVSACRKRVQRAKDFLQKKINK
jgi:RNA polymerase sigma-70 factor (ECF subfamily)